MFRIKPIKNQTTAKYKNLSPHPNQPIIISKPTIDKPLVSKVLKYPPNTFIKNGPKQAIKRLSNLNKQKLISTKNKDNVDSNAGTLQSFPKHKLVSHRVIKQNISKHSNLGIKPIPISKELPKRSDLLEVLKQQPKQIISTQVDQIEPKIVDRVIDTHIQPKNQDKIEEINKESILNHNKPSQPNLQSKKIPESLVRLSQKQVIRIPLHMNQQKIENESNELMEKIRKRRQTRQKQKNRLQSLQQKHKQNQARALDFLKQKQSGGFTMLKLNDQLMHFSLAQAVIDVQIKSVLKTNFNSFPNFQQIQYQLDQLERINQSYEIIRFDQNNRLKDGIKNYRVEIFNRIGQLILKAQQQGYSNPNFHIEEADFQRNPQMPSVTRGLPDEHISKFIKFEQNFQKHQQQCAICLADIGLGQELAELECKHKFHEKCIKDWVKFSANCPKCRFNIKFGNSKPN